MVWFFFHGGRVGRINKTVQLYSLSKDTMGKQCRTISCLSNLIKINNCLITSHFSIFTTFHFFRHQRYPISPLWGDVLALVQPTVVHAAPGDAWPKLSYHQEVTVSRYINCVCRGGAKLFWWPCYCLCVADLDLEGFAFRYQTSLHAIVFSLKTSVFIYYFVQKICFPLFCLV